MCVYIPIVLSLLKYFEIINRFLKNCTGTSVQHTLILIVLFSHPFFVAQ